MTTIKTLHLDNVIENHTQDMTGKVVAITGTTSGTGYVCAREMAKLGASVILLNRASGRATASLEKLREEVPNGTFDAITCDLQDFDSVRNATEAIKAKYDVVDVLCNNAGVMALEDRATKDGYDVQMQTNCISPFLLTKGMFPLLKKSDEARVVNHTSAARLGAPLDSQYFGKNGGDLGGNGTDEENASFSGPRWERYHQSKLANCAFTYGSQAEARTTQHRQCEGFAGSPRSRGHEPTGDNRQDGWYAGEQPVYGKCTIGRRWRIRHYSRLRRSSSRVGQLLWPSRMDRLPRSLLPPEDLLLDPANLRVNWEGCEAAVGEFVF